MQTCRSPWDAEKPATPLRSRTDTARAAPDFRKTVERDASEIARRAADRAVEIEPGVYAEHETVEGYPAEALVEEARDALPVVVGSRGRGGLASMLLGSVTAPRGPGAHAAV